MSLSQCNNLLAYMKAGNSITAAKAEAGCAKALIKDAEQDT